MGSGIALQQGLQRPVHGRQVGPRQAGRWHRTQPVTIDRRILGRDPAGLVIDTDGGRPPLSFQLVEPAPGILGGT